MSNIKYLYVRNEWKNRDITIVSDLFEKEGKTFVKFAWAFRNKKDKFIKREGRKIALSRLENEDPNFSSLIEIEPEKVGFYAIASKILNGIISTKTTPKMYIDDISENLHFFEFFSKMPKKIKTI